MKSNKNYRISYDATFITDPVEGILYNGRKLQMISIWFQYRYYGKNGKEVLFEKDGQPSRFYRCSYDKDTGYKMEYLSDKLKEYTYSKIEYEEENEAFLFYADSNDPVSIPIEEAKQILIKYNDAFNNSDNYPAQSVAYSSSKV